MDFDQQIFNIAVGVAGCLGGWVLNTLWNSIKDLREKVSKVEVLVAGQYVKREEFDRVAEKIFNKLDGISDKLNSKADRQ